jgi:hypothetical protein
MTIRTGKRLTTLCGPLPDTAALYGLLGRLEALGLALVTVRSLPDAAYSDRPPDEPGS